ncbi:MAG TPA: hypothetical protein VK668_01220 [Mucilaginibacter sp.]|nr:hypothetical protein [Mucilaginibacter sp.]
MNRFLVILKNWFAYATAITLLCFLIYIIAQQNFRQAANDPQYQIAEDAATALNKGADPKSLTAALAPVDLLKSLSPFLAIYDANGNDVASNATLNGVAPKIPQGVLDNIRRIGGDAVTWQPQPGIRQAAVAVRSARGIVVAGRSLRKTEERVSLLAQQVLFGWAMSMVAMLVVVTLQEVMTKKLEQLAV